MSSRQTESGLTLIEMLVSLVIFSFVGIASFSMLNTLIQVQTRSEGRLETVARIDRALSVFSLDFAQADPSALQLQNSQLSTLTAPDQRHQYDLRETAFLRSIGPSFGDQVDLEQPLLLNVQGVEFSVLDPFNTWQTTWPVEGVPPAPRAVRVNIELDQNRTVSRIVQLSQVVLP